jgi:hypothetical protein
MTVDKGWTSALDEVQGSLFITESKADQEKVQRLINEVQNKVKELNDGLKSGKTTPTNEQPTQPSTRAKDTKQTGVAGARKISNETKSLFK